MKAKWKTKLMAAVCAAGAVCNLVNVNTLAAAVPAAYEDAVFEVQSGTFTYIPKAGAEPAEDTYYYSDGYFQDSAIGVNPHLASMSMALAFSTFENGGSSYVRDLFGKIGYEDIAIGDMDDTPTRDTIGTAIAHKNVNGQEIVAVAIRGSRYYSEWAANLTAGAEGDIEGIAKPAETVIARIRDYISTNNLIDVKLWITGYSRAASVADLVGVYVNQHPEEFSTQQDDAFIYAFEPMHCSDDATYYGNIICYLNKNDIVGYVYPESWGMRLNGAVIPLGETKTITEKEIHLTAEEKVNDIGTITLEEFLPKFIEFITTDLTREVFSGDCDDAVADIVEMFVSKTPEEQQTLISWLKNDLLPAAQEYENDRFMYIATGEIASGIMQHNSDKMYRQLTDDLLILLDKVKEHTASPFSAEESQMLRDNLYPLLRAVGPVLMRDALYNEEYGVNSPFEEGYDNPDYDPQTAETQLMTYEQYAARIAQMEAEEEERRNNMTDYERGYDAAGKADAWSAGYDDGNADTYMASYDDTVPDSENFSAEYIEGYKQGYHDEYEDGFQCSNSNTDTRTDEEIGYDVGSNAGYQAAWQDAQNGEDHYRESYDDTPFADEYNPYEDEAAYNAGFVRGYAEGYEKTFPEELAWQHQLQMEQPLYHVGTFLLNIQDILAEHYPQTNLKLVQEMDSFYTELNGGQLTITYFDAASFERKTARATLINGTETVLSSGWYAVNQDVTINGDLTLDGSVNLILADGCTLTVNGAVSGDYALGIYGQTDEYGTLAAKSVGVDSYLQSGGIVQLSADTENTLTGKTEVSILGGQLTAEGGITTDGILSLAYVYAADFVRASAYSAATITVGKFFEFYIPNLNSDFLDGYALDCTLHLTENGAVQEPAKADFVGKLAYQLPVLSGELDETAVSIMQGQKLCPYVDDSDVTNYDENGNPYTEDSMPARRTLLTDADFDIQAIEKQGDSYICTIISTGAYTGTAVLELPVYSEEGQIADDAILLAWAEKDYQDKYGTEVMASVAEKENGKMTVRLADETGSVVEQYVIDTATGIGTDSAEEEVNLPQTGSNDPAALFMVGGAFILLLAGAFAVKASRKGTDCE